MTDVIVSFDKKSLQKRAEKFAGGEVHKTNGLQPIRDEWGRLVNHDKFYDVYIVCGDCGLSSFEPTSIPVGMHKSKFFFKNKILCPRCKCRLVE